MEQNEFKFSANPSLTRFYCGLDVHKHELSVCIYAYDESWHEFTKSNVFTTDNQGLSNFWNFVRKFKPIAFGMEATGIYHHVIVKFLTNKRSDSRWNYRILVSNPADIASLPGHRKFDKLDALKIAQYLAKGLLKDGAPIIEILEDLKALFRMAAKLEVQMTAIKNRIRKTLDRAGIRARCFDFKIDWTRIFLYCYTGYSGTMGSFIDEYGEKYPELQKHHNVIVKHTAELLSYGDFSLTHTQRSIIRQYLVELDFIDSKKQLIGVEVDKIMEESMGLRDAAQRLSEIPGISAFSAVWMLAELGPIQQYPNVRCFLSYCGLCPGTRSSANKVFFAHITRHSDKYLRTIFFNAAVVLCNLTKKPSLLKEYAQRVRQRKSSRAQKLVYLIVASKIARVVYFLLKSGEKYQPYPEIAEINQPSRTGFSVSDAKTIKRAIRCLARINCIEELGIIKERAKILAEEMDKALIKKKSAAFRS